jgi:isoleucyl-tRNA synthetase
MLGNLYDYDPETSIKKDALLEIDRYAISLLQSLIKKTDRAYEEFAFHEVFHSIYNFCVTEMSAFYLDVLKDRLYTFRADSGERKAAQWMLYQILTSLTKMMAPVLPFTAEEIWQNLSKERVQGEDEKKVKSYELRVMSEKSGEEDKGQGSSSKGQGITPPIPPLVKGGEGGFGVESVFLTAFPVFDEKFYDKNLEEKWGVLLKIRDEVNKALEIRRQEKFIGNSLEAKIVLYVNEANYAVLKEQETFLPALFIVSRAEILKDTVMPEGVYKSPEIDGLAVSVSKAEGGKCERCWNWSISVGEHEAHPSVCGKCFEVLKT